ncbi:MAG: ParB N-terminal domain-containing protein [Fimbriiglobus sp.]
MSPLEIRVLPVADLTPADYNPRKHLKPTDPAYKKLRASLEQFGLVEPLVWNELTGRVVGGHARLRILRDLGIENVPVSVVRLSEARERALNVVLNNQEAQGRFDTAKLADLLEEMADLPELQLTGFDGKTLAALRYEPAADAGPDPADAARVEITLVADPETFARLEPDLDELVRRFDLETHVRRPGK